VQSTLNSDTLAAHIENFESVASTGGDNTFEQAGIVNFDGSNVLESRYPEGECCNEDDDIDGHITTGTGLDFRAWITSGEISNPIRRLVVSMNVYLDPLFENSSGFKLLALCTEKGNGWDNFTMRKMIVDYSLGTEFDPQYYSHAYWGGFGSPVETGANTKTITPDSYYPRGEWINVAYVVDAGLLNTPNGWTEFFINKKMIVDGRYDIPAIGTGDANGLTYIEFTTFMGGSDPSYLSPRTQ
jgi:hypothetical protein